MKSLESHLHEIEAAAESIIRRCLDELCVVVEDDLFIEAIEGISSTKAEQESLVVELEIRVRSDQRIDWWDTGDEFINKQGCVDVLEQPVMFPAGMAWNSSREYF